MTVLPTGDMTAEITATGTPGAASDQIRLIGATAENGDPDSDLFLGDFVIGPADVIRVNVANGQNNFEVLFDESFGANDNPTGTLFATLDVENWAPVGTTGEVRARGSTVLGTFQIVPEPSAALLVAGGLAGLARAARQRSARRSA